MKSYPFWVSNQLIWTDEEGRSPEPCSRCGGNSTNPKTPKGIEVIRKHNEDKNRDYLYAICQTCDKDYGALAVAP